MNKAELIERIVDAMVDPWTDCPEDYLDATPIDIHEATDLLDQIRSDEQKMNLEYDEMLPKAVTPSLVMEAYNCLIRAKKHEAWIDRLADYLTENECVCEYDQCKDEYLENPLHVLPVDFLDDDHMECFTQDGNGLSASDLISIGMNSAREHTFRFTDEFCWFDPDRMLLHSSDTPFHDGVIDAHAMAEFIVNDRETLDYFIHGVMDEDEVKHVFGTNNHEDILKGAFGYDH